MATKLIQISLPEKLLEKLDGAAQEEFANRSEFVRQAIIERLRAVDEYRAKLAAIATSSGTLTEAEILKLLQRRQVRRGIKQTFKDTGMR